MLASSYWAHFIKYLKGEPATWNHKLCAFLPYQLPKCTVDIALTLLLQLLLILFIYFSFFPRGETWNSFISLTATNPLVRARSLANNLKQWKQDLWKKSFLPHLRMLQGLLRPGEKKEKVHTFLPLCPHLGLSLQKFLWYFFWQGSYNFMQVYLELKQTNKLTKNKTKNHTKCAAQQTVEFRVQYPLLAFFHPSHTTYDNMGWLAQELAQMVLYPLRATFSRGINH